MLANPFKGTGKMPGPEPEAPVLEGPNRRQCAKGQAPLTANRAVTVIEAPAEAVIESVTEAFPAIAVHEAPAPSAVEEAVVGQPREAAAHEELPAWAHHVAAAQDEAAAEGDDDDWEDNRTYEVKLP
jgi:hypothetical protein